MKVLLDECVVQELRHEITGHDVFTVGYMGWKGVRNGTLLLKAASAGFDVPVTTDRGFEHQHNPSTLPVAVLLMRATTNDAGDLLALAPALPEVLSSIPPRTLVVVDP